jgi:RNA polymerase sigma-70 factor (ECF subfamily)
MTLRGVKPSGEDELVSRAQLGDEQAFSALVRGHQNEVFTLANRLVGNREVAADVAQEAFIRAWKALPNFRGDAKFSTWMHRITVNTSWTWRERAKRKATYAIDDDFELVDERQLTPERAGERAELRALIGAHMEALPTSLRAVVVLKDVYGWSHKEVADELGITVSAAKVRLHRARARLRRVLGEAS